MSMQAAKSAGCANCPKMEQKYKDNPRSFWMRLWKWHSGWCPGHKAYRKAEEAKSASHAPKLVNVWQCKTYRLSSVSRIPEL